MDGKKERRREKRKRGATKKYNVQESQVAQTAKTEHNDEFCLLSRCSQSGFAAVSCVRCGEGRGKQRFCARLMRIAAIEL